MNDNPKLPIDDPRYRIEGTDMMNFSKWSRENEPKPDHQHQVGDVVVLNFVCKITKLVRDCDGTALYVLSNGLGGGWSEEQLRAATQEEKDNY